MKRGGEQPRRFLQWTVCGGFPLFLSETLKTHRINVFFRTFSAFSSIFIISPFENAEKACIFLYRLFFHTDRTPEPPAPISGLARGEKELQS